MEIMLKGATGPITAHTLYFADEPERVITDKDGYLSGKTAAAASSTELMVAKHVGSPPFYPSWLKRADEQDPIEVVEYCFLCRDVVYIKFSEYIK